MATTPKIAELKAKDLRCRFSIEPGVKVVDGKTTKDPEEDKIVFWFFRRNSENHLALLHNYAEHVAALILKRKNKVAIQGIKISELGAQMMLEVILRFLVPRWGFKTIMEFVARIIIDQESQIRKNN